MQQPAGLSVVRVKQDKRAHERILQSLKQEHGEVDEHSSKWRERTGQATYNRPKGPLVWIHTPDESAVLIYIGLIERLCLERPDLNFLITTANSEPHLAINGLLPKNCIHQLLPYEEGPGVALFLTHWKPDCCLWADPVLRSSTIELTYADGVPLTMLDASLPDEKQHKLRWFPRAARKVLEHFRLILAVDARTARNIHRLGVQRDRIEVLGAMREGVPPLDCVQSDRDAMSVSLAARPIWLAANTAPEELDIILAAQKHVMRTSHRLLLILELEDAEQALGLYDKLEQDGWLVCLRSSGQELKPDTQILLADQQGELGLWLRLSPVTFVGQTLIPGKGVAWDPFVVTALGSAVLHGGELGVFSANYHRLDQAGAARRVEDSKTLTAELGLLLAPDKVAEMARAAWEVSTAGAEVSDRVCELVLDALDERNV